MSLSKQSLCTVEFDNPAHAQDFVYAAAQHGLRVLATDKCVVRLLDEAEAVDALALRSEGTLSCIFKKLNLRRTSSEQKK